MFNELFGQDNYRSFNIKIANLFGLEAAVYLNELIHLSSQKNGFIKLDRGYIKELTTITIETQHAIDKLFSKLKLVDIQGTDDIKFNYDIYLNLFGSFTEKSVDELSKAIPKKRTKSDAIKDDLKKLIKSDNGELRDAYASWIDSVFAKQGWMSKKSVELGQKLIDEYSNHNLDVALAVLDNASIGGYRDIQWAINTYEEKKKTIKNIQEPIEFTSRNNIQLAQEVF